jgi:hypothetical protein
MREFLERLKSSFIKLENSWCIYWQLLIVHISKT